MRTAADRRRWWTRAIASLARLLTRRRRHPFDRAHRVDTGGLLYADPAAEGPASPLHNAGYYATAPSLFRGALELWRSTLPATGRTLEDYSLVDIGSGKGRVLMLASEYPFREIVGLELDPALVRVARDNLRKWTGQTRSPRPIQIIEGDALQAPLPAGPVVLFYFNSFEREMTRQWLARLDALARARTAPLDLIYVHPEFDALVRQLPRIQPLADDEIPFSNEDAAADAFAVASDRCVVYRFHR